jgi:hypothetical protein
MGKLFSVTASIFLLLLLTTPSFAAKVCLQDNFGGYWELKGGRVDKKTYTVKIIVPNFCIVGGYADVSKENSNLLFVSLFNSHDTAGICNPVFFSAATNLQFAGSGKYDTLADGSIEGTFSITPIQCSALPSNLTEPTSKKISTHPILKKQ